jgi:hypothetical protein
VDKMHRFSLFSATAFSLAVFLGACSGAPSKGSSSQSVTRDPNAGVLQVPADATHHARRTASLPSPKSLISMSRKQILALLGPPNLLREDTPAELWQYQNVTCVMDVFLYKEASGSTYRVAYMETRLRSGKFVSKRECLHSLIKNQGDVAG